MEEKKKAEAEAKKAPALRTAELGGHEMTSCEKPGS
jgi:hypothetical protein